MAENPPSANPVSRLGGSGQEPPLHPLQPIPRGGLLPLSAEQQRLWFLDRLLPREPAFSSTAAVHLTGAVDIATLAGALSALVRRHEILRTTFPVDANGQPRLRIAAAESVESAIAVVDLGALAPGACGAEAERAGRAVSSAPYDLSRDPLLRPLLVRLPEGGARLHLAFHPIVADRESAEIALREVVETHAAAPPALQHADLAAWQRRHFQGEALAAEVGFWRGTLAGAPAVLDLPADRPRPVVRGPRGHRHPLPLPAGFTLCAAQLAPEAASPPLLVLHTVLAALVARLSGQDDLVIGRKATGRERPELRGTIGPLANDFAVRTPLLGDPSLAALLPRVGRAAAAALAHAALPFAQLLDELRLEPALHCTPLFQVAVELADPKHAGGDIAPGFAPGTARCDLLVSLAVRGGAATASLDLSADLFDAATGARLAGHLASLLAAALAAQDTPLSGLPLLSAAERHEIVATWNETWMALPAATTLHGLVEAQAARTPHAVALLTEATGAVEELAYAELNGRANRLARHLRRLGVGPEVLVGLAVERSAEMVVALLAVLKAGGAYVPLDPGYPADRLAYVIEDSRLTVLVTQAELRYSLPEDGPRPVRFVEIEAGDGGPGSYADWSDESAADLPPSAAPMSPAYVIYTSGSTGRPKGVVVPHAAVVNFLASMARRPGLAAADTLLAVTTLSFDIAGLELWLPLSVGGRVAIASRETAGDGPLLAAALLRHRATAMQATPATWRLLLGSGWAGTPGLAALCGGEALPPDLAAALLGRVGSLWNLYGPTETTIWSTVENVTADGPLTIGRPIANTTTYLLDGRFEPVPVGSGGELYLGGSGLARGYLNRPDLTAERFVPDPFGGEGGRLYRTGDVARARADGRIVYAGRADHQVKVRGFRIEPGEIETVLVRHPAVRQAVVVARDDIRGHRQLAGFYVPADSAAVPEAATLRSFLKESLPDYMVPAVLQPLAALPLTPNGKVDRKALPVLGASGTPGDKDFRDRTPPTGPLQSALVALFAEALGTQKVGVHESFFAAGGDSLKAARLVVRIRQSLGANLALRAVFEQPTVAGLAGVLGET